MEYQIPLMLFCMLFCMIVRNEKSRDKVVLPVCFIALTVFFAIRYYYGLDYGSYLDAFETGATSARGGEEEVDPVFYTFMHLFGRFYVFVIVHTLLLFGALFYLTRKYCDHRLYILFFLLLLTQNGLIFNMISAMRNALAAIILWVTLDLFYIRKKRWVPFVFGVILGSLFHKSAIAFLILPLADFIFIHVKSRVLIIAFLVAAIIPMFFANTIFQAATNVESFSAYQYYAQSDFTSNINGVFVRALWLFPTFYIIKYSGVFKGKYQGLYVLSLMFMFIFIINMDWQDRFSTYLKIFWIFALSQVMPKLKFSQKLIAIVPVLLASGLAFYQFITSMYTEYLTTPGNYLFYQTIFDAPKLP